MQLSIVAQIINQGDEDDVGGNHGYDDQVPVEQAAHELEETGEHDPDADFPLLMDEAVPMPDSDCSSSVGPSVKREQEDDEASNRPAKKMKNF